jgi:hypothetical protein
VGRARPRCVRERASRSTSRASSASRTRRSCTCPGGAGAGGPRLACPGFGDFWAHMLVAEGAAELAVDAPDLAVWDAGAAGDHPRGGGRPLRELPSRGTG